MNFIDRVRAATRVMFSNESNLITPEEWLTELIGGKRSKSGIMINAKNAMSCVAAYACINVLSSTLACTPLHVYHPVEGGGRERFRDHPVDRLLSREWNEWLTAFRGWRVFMVNACLTEAGYIEVVRKGGRPVALYPIPTKFVTKSINKRTLEPQYTVDMGDGDPHTIRGNCMIEVPGLGLDAFTAFEPITLLKEALGLSLSAEQYSSEFFAQGTHPTGIITYPGSLRKANDEKFKTDLRESYSGLGKKKRLMILEEGLKFEKIATSPSEGQMIEARKFQATEMARFFNVPPHKIMDYDRATWGNIEEINASFITDTMLPWYLQIEQAVMQTMLNFEEERKQGIYAEFDTNMFMRGKLLDRYTAYRNAIMYGFMTPNQALAKENMPGFAGGDWHWMPTNMQRIDDETQKQTEPRKASQGGKQ